MIKEAVVKHGISIRLACECISLSQTFYRYQPILSDQNTGIADWLVQLTSSQEGLPIEVHFLLL